MDVFVELRAVISEFTAKMAEARGEMEHTAKAGGGHMAALGKAGGLALAAVATAGAGIGAASVKMASEFEDSRARLEKAVDNSGASFSKIAGQVSVYEGRLEKLGFTHTQTDDALANLTTALGSPQKAMAALGLAADLARYKHIGLAEASIVVAKAEEGQLRPLKQLGIDLPVVASTAEKVKVAQENLGKAQAAVNAILAKSPDAINPASKAHGVYEKALGKVSAAQQKVSDLAAAGGLIMDALSQKIGGQAATAAGTFGGKLEVAKAKVEDLGISLGLKLIPVIEHVVAWLTTATDWLKRHKTVLEVLGATVGTVAAVMVGAWVAVQVAALAAFVAENLATLGIIAALIALGAAAVYLATHWHQVWADIKRWTDDAIKFLRGGFGTLILAMQGPIGWALLIALHWQGMWRDIKHWTLDGVNAVVGFFVRMGHDIKQWTLDGVNAVVGFFVRMGHDIKQWTLDAVNAVKGFFLSMWQTADGYARNMWRDVTGFFAAIWRDAVASVKGLAHDLTTWFTGIVFGIAKIMGRLPGQLLQLGKDMISEMVKGIVGAIPSVLGAVGSVVSSILHKFHLGFLASPSSRVMQDVGRSLMQGLADGINKHLHKATGAAVFAAGSVVSTMTDSTSAMGMGIPGAAAGGWAAVGKAMAAQYGWTGAEWNALNAVAMRESGWNPNAQNPTSSAYGIAQNIGGRAGYPDPSPAGQIAWMLAYIKGRYGDPINAWAHEMSAGWYDRGGLLPPGLSLALNTTGHAEVVRPGPASPAGPATIILQVDGKTLGRVVLDSLLQEQQRRPLGIKAS